MAFVFVSEEFVLSLKKKIAKNEDIQYQLKECAGEFYKQGTFTITDYPCERSVGTINDYYSEAPYYWPNPQGAHLPFIAKDGEVYPGRFTMHKNLFSQMAHAFLMQILAGFYLDNTKYIDRAAEILKVFFIDEKTKMNPHLNYGEAIINQCSGRKSGIIVCTNLNIIVYGLAFLEKTNKHPQLVNNMKTWLKEMLVWLTQSKLGIEESKAENNHGAWYNTHVATIAAYLNEDKIFTDCVEYFKENVIAKQIEPSGDMPKELHRTRTLHYSLFGLDAMLMMCELAHQKNIDLYNYKTHDNRCIKNAVDIVAKGIINPFSWQYNQIVGDIPVDEFSMQYGAQRLNLQSAKKANEIRGEGTYAIKCQSPLGPISLLEGYNFPI